MRATRPPTAPTSGKWRARAGGRLRSTPNFEGFPTTFFIGKDGLIADRVLSEHEYSELEAIVVTLLEQKEKK